MKFSEWITRKYVEWRGDAIGREKSISDFAAWIGVSQPLMTGWMKEDGYIPKSQKAINALVKRFGAEVYDVLKISPPNENHQISEINGYSSLTPEERAIYLVNLVDELVKDMPPGVKRNNMKIMLDHQLRRILKGKDDG